MFLMTQRMVFCGKTVMSELKNNKEQLDSECEEVLVIIHFCSPNPFFVLKSDTYFQILWLCFQETSFNKYKIILCDKKSLL